MRIETSDWSQKELTESVYDFCTSQNKIYTVHLFIMLKMHHFYKIHSDMFITENKYYNFSSKILLYKFLPITSEGKEKIHLQTKK